MKTYYKVVGVEYEDRFFSCSIDLQHPIEYKFNEWKTPLIKKSKLFVFNSFVEAEKFREKMENVLYFTTKLRVFPCLVKNPSPLYHICPTFYTNQLIAFWEKPTTSHPAPNGTVGVDEVKLLNWTPAHRAKAEYEKARYLFKEFHTGSIQQLLTFRKEYWTKRHEKEELTNRETQNVNFLLVHLLTEVMREHADPDSDLYNGCDTNKCRWCENAQKIIDKGT